MAVKATSLVGLDVHARQTHAALLDVASGEVVGMCCAREGKIGYFLSEAGFFAAKNYNRSAFGPPREQWWNERPQYFS